MSIRLISMAAVMCLAGCGEESTVVESPGVTKRVIYNGVEMIEGWPERIQDAQQIPSYSINGVERPRVRYGEEAEDWGANQAACHDCAVITGQLHVPGCDVERCPACAGQALSCDCDYDGDSDDE